MWKVMFTKVVVSGTIGVEVSKDVRRGESVYSTKIGSPRADGTISSFISSPEQVTNDDVLAAMNEAREYIAQNRKYDEESEQRRIAELTGKGKGKNPLANTGLSRFKKKQVTP